ncbi:hypothetical protein PV08_09816 [Exophiala spinifera]|uniref:Uncharacterized protein n=1 Tax=Exophiala spinifera TaxID=91928 RepID=A0A0D2BN51_9EURO|nr:uncharacterized protein PV08_09816 [Exophiala spinifera]KIW12539.1 hypothetical protein PV08_09816 [Exophiala spinifera]
MKVLDPQAALFTTAEVYHFLASNPPRPQQKQTGSYPSVNTKGYQQVRDDFDHYISTTSPYIKDYPAPETFVKAVVPKLKAFGLTKTEIFNLINLGVGLSTAQSTQKSVENSDGMDVDGDGAGEDAPEEPDYRQMLSLIVEELDDRFSGDEGESKIQKIFDTMRSEYERAKKGKPAKGTKAKVNGTKSK